MSKIIKASINPELLVWARNEGSFTVEKAAEFLKVPFEKLSAWENGEDFPTINQLREIAKKYRITFAAFFYPTPPPSRKKKVNDFRLHPESPIDFSHLMAFEVRNAIDKREIMLEMYEDLGEKPKEWQLKCLINNDPEKVAQDIRSYIGLSIDLQRKWRDNTIAFPAMRQLLEKTGVLVLQATKLDLKEMRGLSISEFPLPIVIINRKDSAAGRIFSIFHELAHVALRSSSLCDLNEEDNGLSEGLKTIEFFCNRVAGACLVPKTDLLNNEIVKNNSNLTSWGDEDLAKLAKLFCVSKETILRRLLVLGKTTNSFYRLKRNEFIADFERIKNIKKKRSGFVTPAVNSVSSSGKLYSGLVLGALSANKITTSDASDFLGVRLKHFDTIARMTGSGGSG